MIPARGGPREVMTDGAVFVHSHQNTRRFLARNWCLNMSVLKMNEKFVGIVRLCHKSQMSQIMYIAYSNTYQLSCIFIYIYIYIYMWVLRFINIYI